MAYGFILLSEAAPLPLREKRPSSQAAGKSKPSLQCNHEDYYSCLLSNVSPWWLKSF